MCAGVWGGGALVGALALLLAGCVVWPAPVPARSPLPTPTVKSQHYYLPVVRRGPLKVGIAQNLQYRSCDTLQRLGAEWSYDWSPNPLPCPGVESVPMVWAPGDGALRPIAESPYLLVFNECDRPDQCNTDPETAAVWWHLYSIQNPDRKLVGPNISHAGTDWLLAWHAAYVRLFGQAPRMWALGVHCYNVPELCQPFVADMARLAQTWTASGQLWLTEWAVAACWYGPRNPAQASADASEFLAWLLNNPHVAREAWYIAQGDPDDHCSFDTSLLDGRAELTTYGEWYQAFRLRQDAQRGLGD